MNGQSPGIIDNPKTMVTYVSRSRDRIFHPRFLALLPGSMLRMRLPASG